MATYESRRYNTPVEDVTKVADGSVSNAEFEHLDGVTSDIQTQLTARLPLAGGTMTGTLSLGDNDNVTIGDGTDLILNHDGSNSTITNKIGVLKVLADTVQFKNKADNATFLTLNSSSSFLSLADVYPVGSIYINATNSTNPSSLLGFGTWARFGEGKMLISQLSSDSDFDTAGETGGAKTHTIAQANLPSVTLQTNESVKIEQAPANRGSSSGGGATYAKANIPLGGSDTPINQMNPYIVVYMWKRTA